MPDKKLIAKKLSEIFKQLEHLSKLVKLSQRELFGNESNFYFAERVMERLIGAAIDINMHLIADLKAEVPESYFDSFLALAKVKILPFSFAKRIAPSTSLRNILVHEYQALDSKKFMTGLKMALRDYEKYARYIDIYCRKH